MALSEDDLQAVKQLLDGYFAEHRARERRRRRWGWLLLVVLLVGPVIPSVFVLKKWWAEFQEMAAQQDKDLGEARAAYQRELAKSQIMQKERDEAVARSKYNGNISNADYEAGLLRSMIQMYNQQAKVRESLKNVDADDPDSLEATADELSTMLDSSLGAIMQMALRNTDPAQPAQKSAPTVHAMSDTNSAPSVQTNSPSSEASQSPALSAHAAIPATSPASPSPAPAAPIAP